MTVRATNGVRGRQVVTSGFTLLEVLVAVAIFALLGLGTYRMLQSVLQADQRIREQAQALGSVSRGLSALERDLVQAIARPVRQADGIPGAALAAPATGREGQELAFTRAGWRNPVSVPRAGLQRVRWRRVGDVLERSYWNVLDQAPGSEPRVQRVLEGVTALQWRFLSDDGRWLAAWPPVGGSVEALPRAVEVGLEHVRFGHLRRVFPLAADTSPKSAAP